MSNITDKTWWRAALARAFRTAAVVAIPYVPVTMSVSDYWILASAFGMGFILSILTSLAGIAEVGGGEVPWWYAAVSRVVKTVAQALVTAVGSATLFSEVDWSVIPALVVSSAVGSLLLAVVRQLPESHTPTSTNAVEIVGVSTPTGTVSVPTTTNVTVVADSAVDGAEIAKAVSDSIRVNHGYHGE